MDDLDAWTAALNRRGIYVDLNLLVGRTFKEGDGVQDRANVGWAKALAYFDPRPIELQKEFPPGSLLAHRNPYTGHTYADEPAVAIALELVNENSLWDAWYYDRLHLACRVAARRGLPAHPPVLLPGRGGPPLTTPTFRPTSHPQRFPTSGGRRACRRAGRFPAW